MEINLTSKVDGREHALVKNPQDEHTVRLASIKHCVATDFQTAHSGPNGITGSPDQRILCKNVKALLETGHILSRLTHSPFH